MPTLLPTSTQLGNTSIVKYISMIAEAQAETALPLSEKDQKLSPRCKEFTLKNMSTIRRGAMLVFKR